MGEWKFVGRDASVHARAATVNIANREKRIRGGKGTAVNKHHVALVVIAVESRRDVKSRK